MSADISVTVNRPYIRQPTTLTARVDVDPDPTRRTATRHLAICIDTSSSMNRSVDDTGESPADEVSKLEHAKRALTGWVYGLLDDNDYASIVAFDSDPEVVLSPTQWGQLDRRRAEDAVESLTAGGNTDIYGALEEAASSVADLSSVGTAAKRVLLFSDGKQNSPRKSVDEFESLAERVDERGVRIYAGAIGDDYREKTIRALGTTARGEWEHVQSPGKIQNFFGSIVERAGTVVGPDAELRIDPRESIEIGETYRSADQAQQADVVWEGPVARIKLPDLRYGRSQTVGLEIDPPAGGVGNTVTLADLELRSAGRTWAEETVTVTYTDEPRKLQTHNEDALLEFMRTKVRSKVGQGSLAEAKTTIEHARTLVGESSELNESFEEEFDRLEESVTRIEEHDGERNGEEDERSIKSEVTRVGRDRTVE